MTMSGLYDVRMTLSGAISVRNPINLEVMKGTRNPFMTNVKIANSRYGVDIKVQAYGRDTERAAQSALFFAGEMVNVLALRLNSPLHLGLADQDIEVSNRSVRRIIGNEEWRDFFTLGRDYGLSRPVFSRAISWYRKGLNTDEPIDKLLAIWLSLEVIGKNFGRKQGPTQSQIINQITSCFNCLWQNEAQWKVIPNASTWFYAVKNKRNDIAHGNFSVHPEYIQTIAEEAPQLQALAHAFLTDWEQRPAGDSSV